MTWHRDFLGLVEYVFWSWSGTTDAEIDTEIVQPVRCPAVVWQYFFGAVDGMSFCGGLISVEDLGTVSASTHSYKLRVGQMFPWALQER